MHSLCSCAALSAPTALRVLVADDHPVVLAGVRALLDGDPDIEIVGETLDGRTALQMAIKLQPSIVLLDLSMPGLDGVEVTRQLLARHPGCKVVALTVHEDRSYLRELIEVGAVGYVLKRSAAKVLLHAIHAVAEGGIYLDPLIAVHALDRSPKKPKEAAEGHAELDGNQPGCSPTYVHAPRIPYRGSPLRFREEREWFDRGPRDHVARFRRALVILSAGQTYWRKVERK